MSSVSEPGLNPQQNGENMSRWAPWARCADLHLLNMKSFVYRVVKKMTEDAERGLNIPAPFESCWEMKANGLKQQRFNSLILNAPKHISGCTYIWRLFKSP